ncbi:MAG TPA: aspartate aminotransferase family protein, partial [Aquifex aeolicus]|nr:aspartate aminotransferase family protein [Aquifex aeolicus]
KEVVDFESARSSDTELFSRFFRSLLRHGVLIPPSQFEAWFIGTAHEEEHIEEALARIRDAVKDL